MTDMQNFWIYPANTINTFFQLQFETYFEK